MDGRLSSLIDLPDEPFDLPTVPRPSVTKAPDHHGTICCLLHGVI